MHQNSIRFLHIGDTHFGVHYALRPKNLHRRAYGELFFQKVKEVINTAISVHHVDFIIHSGDFFNRSKPPPEVVDRGIKPFQLAARKGIPIYVLPGNHERSKLPLGLISFSDDNINLFSRPCSYIFEKDGINIKIIGFPYIRRNARKKFNPILKRAYHNSIGINPKKNDYSILVTHQLIEGSRIEKFTFRKGNNVITFFQIPRKFNYIACGHIHRFQFLYNQKQSSRSTNKLYKVKQDNLDQRWQFNDKNGFPSTNFRNPIIAYAGSLDRVSIAERNEPKGYIIGELQLSGTEHGIRAAKYQFHELSAIEMVYYVWDLSKASIEDYVNQTLEKIYGIHSIKSSSRNNKEKVLSAILKIKIKGNGFHASKKIEYLKQEAKRLKVYLTFSYMSISA